MPLTLIVNKKAGGSISVKHVESVVVMVNDRAKHPKPFIAVDGMARVYFPPMCHERADFFEKLDEQEEALYDAMVRAADALEDWSA